AHRLAQRLAKVRKNGTLPFLLPDGKTQVTVEYELGLPKRIEAVVVSTHHTHDVTQKEIAEGVGAEVIDPVLKDYTRDARTKVLVNPSGRAHPTSIAVETFGTGTVSEDELLTLVRRHFDLRPGAIIDRMDLRRPIYLPTAAYGHFGRDDLRVPWELTDKVEALRADSSVRARAIS